MGDKAGGAMTEAQSGKFCDCLADKMLSKYKSEAEADKNKEEAGSIAIECATDAMK
jgi:hypothetical protein